MAARSAAVLAALALAFSLVALYLALRRPAAEASVTAPDPEETAEAEELAHLMAFAQRYAEKLYFAGTADNAALAQFYVEELEETFEEVEAGGYVEEGRDVAELVRTVARPAIEGVEHAVAAEALSADVAGARALFEARYADLVGACNSCHETTGHGYVRIVVPPASSFPNQDFRPAGTE